MEIPFNTSLTQNTYSQSKRGKTKRVGDNLNVHGTLPSVSIVKSPMVNIDMYM